MRRVLLLAIISAAVLMIAFAYFLWRGANEVAALQPGMVTLQLPTGGTAYLHRQAYSARSAEVYLSANGDFCAPYDRGHDYKLPQVIQGGSESPVLLSYAGAVIVIHSPESIQSPQRTGSDSFRVELQPLTPEAYASYIGAGRTAVELPAGWIRVEIPFGHNTCAL